MDHWYKAFEGLYEDVGQAYLEILYDISFLYINCKHGDGAKHWDYIGNI
jgi:hypothetical protein